MIELGLSRISRIVTHNHKWQAIHIAGTNGKGSVAAYLSALFCRNGFRVGRFTSPHLIDRWDCITVNQKTVTENVFIKVEQGIKSQANEAAKVSGEDASEFELLTATAFELFDRNDVEIAVIECGLGGRGDATNILQPQDVLVSVITKIGLDHQDLLGDTIGKIALEKAGIFKKDVPVVVDASNDVEVTDVLRNEAEHVATQMFRPSNHESVPAEIKNLFTSLPRHQKENLYTAIAAFVVAIRRSVKHEDARIWSYLENQLSSIIEEVQQDWQGRLQWLSIEAVTGRAESILLDGAHNAQSAQALREYVDERIRTDGKHVTWVMAMKVGKDVENILSTLLRIGDIFVATEFGAVDGMPWVKCGSAAVLSKQASDITVGKTMAVPNMKEALKQAVNMAGSGPIVIAGSLYLVSDVLRLLERGWSYTI